jgi:cysteine desulfurase
MAEPESYLDWNSTTPPLPTVSQALADAAQQLWGNPASVHGAGRRARAELEATRELLAASLGFEARDVLFTSGGTEANNLALNQASALVLSRLEHPSVTRVAERLQAGGTPVKWLPVTTGGQVLPSAVERALDELGGSSAPTVAVMAVNHETGVLQPLEAIGQVVRARAARLHVDAVQLLGKGELSMLEQADSVAVAAHKIRGPKGIGAILFRGAAPQPLLLGGAQERGLRPGTQDALAALGFRLALQHCLQHRAEWHAHVGALRDALEAGLHGLGGLRSFGQVNGLCEARLPHVTNVSFARFPGPELVAALDLRGVRVSSGSACSAGTSEPSPVVQAMLGLERARTAVRFSLGETSNEHDVERVLLGIREILSA